MRECCECSCATIVGLDELLMEGQLRRARQHCRNESAEELAGRVDAGTKSRSSKAKRLARVHMRIVVGVKGSDCKQKKQIQVSGIGG